MNRGKFFRLAVMMIGLWLPGIGIANASSPPANAIAMREACDRDGFQEVLFSESAGHHHGKAQAVWLNRRLIKWPGVGGSGNFWLIHSANGQIVARLGAPVSGADGRFSLDVFNADVAPDVVSRFKYVADGVVLSVRENDMAQWSDWHKQQLVLVNADADGNVLHATTLQIAGALDDQFADAERIADLGVFVRKSKTRFNLWAPTARQVWVCVFDSGKSRARFVVPMNWQAANGAWMLNIPANLSGRYYTYVVDVYVHGVGVVRNRVTDPYSISLTTDSRRSYIVDLNDASLKPAGWNSVSVVKALTRVRLPTDMVIYELHVRDFSIGDGSVPRTHRGKYTAFMHAKSNGMKHLRALSDAGMTDVHLLPVFDFATVPEGGCATPRLHGPKMLPDGESQQAMVVAGKERDCFNWGYDPLHFTAPEGSYATDAEDGARRIIEFRQMVAALNQIGLRVGMDVVYNHTSASGQNERSVLDRIVPGYYHRLNAVGQVERSTCCDNTATENMMMAKLMLDSVVVWARDYKIDSFRFDLMGHQPRVVMEAMQKHLQTATGRHINLIGEGWNFGEVVDGARFIQASQLSLNGSGIGTFSDRGRDAVRGGGATDSREAMIRRQGYINGLGYDPNVLTAGEQQGGELLQIADQVRVGLAGSIRNFQLNNHRGKITPLYKIQYAGQPAGYVSEPGEVVNYVENHDNQTLFDINVYKLPTTTSREDRARVQILALAINTFSQGIAYFHAGGEMLRSKSLDRNSYDSGDWFNQIDWLGRNNFFGIGAPPKPDNGGDYHLIKPLLANANIKPTATEIGWTNRAFQDLLRIRASSVLFRLPSADQINSRLTFHNVGAGQIPTVLVGHLNGEGLQAAGFNALIYLINVDKTPQSIRIGEMVGKDFTLHPVHRDKNAADKRVARHARFNAPTGEFIIPARSAVVFVVP